MLQKLRAHRLFSPRLRCAIRTALTHVVFGGHRRAGTEEAIIAADRSDNAPLTSVDDGTAIANHQDVSMLVKHVHARLEDLGLSQLAASKLGQLSRSTLATLGKGGKIPSATTLDKLDELLSWEPGSAAATLHGADPVAREVPVKPERVISEPADDYPNLAKQIEQRLRELNMSKSKFAALGGPGRSTLATLGKRGYQPAADTLDRIDKYLLWEDGSALAALRGGLAIRRGPTPTPHPSLVPLNAVQDRLRRIYARLTRYEQGISQMKDETMDAINHVTLAINDLGDIRRRDALSVFSETASDEPAETPGTAP